MSTHLSATALFTAVFAMPRQASVASIYAHPHWCSGAWGNAIAERDVVRGQLNAARSLLLTPQAYPPLAADASREALAQQVAQLRQINLQLHMLLALKPAIAGLTLHSRNLLKPAHWP